MKKIILGIVLLVILATGAGIYYVYTNLDMLVKMAIEKYGSEAVQTAVRVDKVRIKLTEGTASISGLTIDNPPGFDAPHAFLLGEISVGIDIDSLTKSPIVIKNIAIAGPQIFFEINADKKANLDVLSKNLTAGAPAAQPEKKPEPTAEEPKLRIQKVSLSKAALEAKVVPLNNKEYSLTLPTIEMKNLGGKNGAPPAEIARQMMDQLLDRVRAEVKKQGIGKELKQKIDAKKAELKSEAEEKVDTKKKKAADKLKSRLQR
jgi:hypothetical protein